MVSTGDSLQYLRSPLNHRYATAPRVPVSPIVKTCDRVQEIRIKASSPGAQKHEGACTDEWPSRSFHQLGLQ